MDSIGKRLRKLRGERTQLDVAKTIGIDNSVLSRMESDEKKTLDPDILNRLADYFGVSIDYIITGEHQMEQVNNDTVSPEEQNFLTWVERELEGAFFYDFAGSPEEMKQEMMDDLRVIWKLRKGKNEEKANK